MDLVVSDMILLDIREAHKIIDRTSPHTLESRQTLKRIRRELNTTVKPEDQHFRSVLGISRIIDSVVTENEIPTSQITQSEPSPRTKRFCCF